MRVYGRSYVIGDFQPFVIMQVYPRMSADRIRKILSMTKSP